MHSSFKAFEMKPDILLKINFEKKLHEIYVLIRPGVKEFLENLVNHYELVLFTASLAEVYLYLFSMQIL